MVIWQRHHPADTATGEVPPGVRLVDTIAHADLDPPEPFEPAATENDLKELATRRFDRLPHRPATLADLPDHALEDLRQALGDLRTDQLFVIPRSLRTAGPERLSWVVTPTQVLAVGESSIAVWVDDPAGRRVGAHVPFADVAAILDRNILLYGRLELVGGDAPIVVRFNAVGRPELRGLLVRLRQSFEPVAPPLPSGVGHDPADLPHKWMALLHSTEVQPFGSDRLVVAAGDLLDPAPRLHNGVAVLSSRELLVATDPTADPALAQYGVDLLAVPRRRVAWISGSEGVLRVGVTAPGGPVELTIAADPSLVADATATLGPLIAAG